MSQHPFSGKTTLITGGSGGIGFELARLFLRAGSKVILIGSSAKKLEEASNRLEKEFGAKIITLAKDLSPSSASREVFEVTQKWPAPVDILVNNAGFGISGYFHSMPELELFKMVRLNTHTVLELTRLYLPGMVERGFGRILNVASTAAFQGIPIEAAYAASKAFVLTLSEGLHDELKSKGVGVTCLCPGPTETSFFTRGSINASTVIKRVMMSPEAVAKTGFNALIKQKPVVIAGFRNKFMIFTERFAPRKWVTKIARKMVE